MKIIYLPLTLHNISALHEFMHKHKTIKIGSTDYYIDSMVYPFGGDIRLELAPVIYQRDGECS